MIFQSLVTTINQTPNEIEQMLNGMNISGDVLVGNQCGKNGAYEIAGKKYRAKVIELSEYGASLNRNTILKLAVGTYVTFVEEDTIFSDDYLDICQAAISRIDGKKYNAVRLNIQSLNPERPIKQIFKESTANFKKLRPFGVCGIIFNREFLLTNSLLFNEDIGPGKYISYGEDSLFLANFIRNKGKLLLLTLNLYKLKQTESTWFGTLSIPRELISAGFVHQALYPNIPYLPSLYFAIRRFNGYRCRVSLRQFLRLLLSGNNLYFEYLKVGIINLSKISKIEESFVHQKEGI